MRELTKAVASFEPDLLVMAGWMRLLDDTFCAAHRVVNLHPALPGHFPGLHAIERAFAEWQDGSRDHSGAMVHWVVDSGVDNGPVIDSIVVPFADSDTLEAFEARMHDAEHLLIVRAVGAALTELGVAA